MNSHEDDPGGKAQGLVEGLGPNEEQRKGNPLANSCQLETSTCDAEMRPCLVMVWKKKGGFNVVIDEAKIVFPRGSHTLR